LTTARFEDFAETYEIETIELVGDRSGAIVVLSATPCDVLGDSRQQMRIKKEKANMTNARRGRYVRQRQEFLRRTMRPMGGRAAGSQRC
jgi:hypothetical protein